MYEKLGSLINYIQGYYEKLNQLWKASEAYQEINLKRKLIVDIQKEPELYKAIVTYQSFIEDFTFDFYPDIEAEDVVINFRTKAYDSLNYKIHRNMKGKLKGKIPINKILNDIFGIRIILEERFTYEDIKNYIEQNFAHLICIDSSKNGYNGIHIYFKKDNFSLWWELQVWSRENEQTNKELHKLYKQDYINWISGTKEV